MGFPRYPKMPRGTCYQSSRTLADLYPELSYVEGYVEIAPQLMDRPGAAPVRVAHAWNVTPHGTVVDSTWPYPEVERRYFPNAAAGAPSHCSKSAPQEGSSTPDERASDPLDPLRHRCAVATAGPCNHVASIPGGWHPPDPRHLR
jgi:hypothetical protein